MQGRPVMVTVYIMVGWGGDHVSKSKLNGCEFDSHNGSGCFETL